MMVRFIVALLATWRVTHLLVKEDGPWQLIASWRNRLGAGFWGQLLDCFHCLSLWIALPFAGFVGGTIPELIVLWLALSGGAILLEEQIRNPFIVEGEANGLLRSAADGADAYSPAKDDKRPANSH